MLRRALAVAMSLGAVAAAGPIASASACEGEGGAPGGLSELAARQAILCLINQRRAEAGLGSLTESPELDRAAQGHTVAMSRKNFYGHGRMKHRIRRSGYLSGASTWNLGENLGWGRKQLGSPRAMVNAWMASGPHREVLLSGAFRDVGIGMTKGSPLPKIGHNSGTYTVDFGARN